MLEAGVNGSNCSPRFPDFKNFVEVVHKVGCFQIYKINVETSGALKNRCFHSFWTIIPIFVEACESSDGWQPPPPLVG